MNATSNDKRAFDTRWHFNDKDKRWTMWVMRQT